MVPRDDGMYLLSSPFYVLVAVSLSLVFPALSPNAWFFYSRPRFLEFGDGGWRQAGQSTCVYTCLGIGVGFFCYMWRVFYIYFSLCIFFKHLFLMFGEFIHPHLPGTLTSTTTMGVWSFLLLLFLFSYLSEFWFLRKILLLLFILVKNFFLFISFLLFTFIRVDFFVLLFLSCTYASKYRFTRSFLSLSGGFQRFPPLCFIMLNIFFSYPWRFCFVPCLYCFALEFLFGLYFLFLIFLLIFFEIKFSFFLSRRFFSDVGFFLFYFFLLLIIFIFYLPWRCSIFIIKRNSTLTHILVFFFKVSFLRVCEYKKNFAMQWI